MSDIASPGADRLPAGRIIRTCWIIGATGCAIAMWQLPGQETIPYHLIWIGLSLVYGLTDWRPIELMVTVLITALVTGGIMVHSAAEGWIGWAEVAEVPLSIALTAVIASYLRKRHNAMAQLARIAHDRHLLVRQVSHELRTPITIARGHTELIRRHLTDPAAIEDADIVLEELDKLAQITQRLVTLIHIDGSYDRRPLDLGAELARVVHRWRATADRRWEVSAPAGEVPANRDRLEAALDCLLDNAVRFTVPDDRISVIGAIDSRSWMVEVADSGAGMDPSSGTGWGLATVHTIARTWGGEVTVRTASGSGTVVVMRFPLPDSVDDSSVMNVAGVGRRS